ncbi:hypothetical protein COOONC_17618 [Cooperia oncophora]
MTKRTFQVRLGKTFSNVRAASSGVPQGCVLSPILYNIYTYELPRLVENAAVHCKVFADDMKIYRSVSDASDSNIIQNAIDVVSAWSKRRKMFDLITVYKIFTGKLSLKFQDFFTLRNSITRGEKNKLVVPRSKTRVRTKFFAIRAATQFSKLMKSSTLPKNIAQFKNLLHHHFK